MAYGAASFGAAGGGLGSMCRPPVGWRAFSGECQRLKAGPSLTPFYRALTAVAMRPDRETRAVFEKRTAALCRAGSMLTM